jgi:hypothetical protein
MKKTEKTRTHFTFRIDTWTADGESIVEPGAGLIPLPSYSGLEPNTTRVFTSGEIQSR